MINIKAMEKIHNDCRKLGEKKNNDYTSRIDPIAITKLPGISTRLLDKVSRFDSLTSTNKKQLVKDESIRDTLMDMINYATYGIMLIDDAWENK